MIKSLCLKNFQSHEETKINVSNGINVLIGDTAAGKSAVLRGLYWLIENRPLGIGHVSFWARNDKDKLLDSCFVEVQLDDGSVIRRERNKDFNGYIIKKDGQTQTYEAGGSDVPEPIINLLNMGNINIQKQMDVPFLVSETAGEVSRYLNKLIQIDIIDTILANVESAKRSTNSEINKLTTEIESVESKIKGYDWVEKAERTYKKLNILNQELQEKTEQRDCIQKLILSYTTNFNQSTQLEKILSTCMDSFNELQTHLKTIEGIQPKVDRLKNLIERYETSCQTLQKTKELSKAEKLVKQLNQLSNETQVLHTERETVLESIAYYKDNIALLNKLKDEIQIKQDALPEVCPVCNGKGRLK